MYGIGIRLLGGEAVTVMAVSVSVTDNGARVVRALVRLGFDWWTMKLSFENFRQRGVSNPD